MLRSRRFRSILALLLAFCLVSASLWSVSPEAMADALGEEVGFTSVDGGMDHGASGSKVCNHGCHAQSHLTGIDSGAVLTFASVAETPRWAEVNMTVVRCPHDGPFRPPRNTFQA